MRKVYSAGLVLVAVVAAVLAFSLLRTGEAQEPAIRTMVPADDPGPVPAVRQEITIPVLAPLSPETRVAAERFRCICGCPDILSACLCTKTPGGITMKNYLQTLVDRKLSNEEIDRAMEGKYGPEVLLFSPARQPSGSDSSR